MFGETTKQSNQPLNKEPTSEQSPNFRQQVIAGACDQSMPRNEIQKYTIFSLCSIRRIINPARTILAEFVGTFILMFSISGILGSMRLLGNEVGLMEYAITAGSAIIVVVFCLGAISGAHVNPAVTIAFAVFGHFSWSKVPFYVSAQLLGSIFATYIGELVYGVKPELMITQPVKDGASSAFWAEFIATFIVTFLAASLARDPKSLL